MCRLAKASAALLNLAPCLHPPPAWLHDRAPLILTPAEAAAWLDVRGRSFAHATTNTDNLRRVKPATRMFPMYLHPRLFLPESPSSLVTRPVHKKMTALTYQGGDAGDAIVLAPSRTTLHAFFPASPGASAPAPAPSQPAVPVSPATDAPAAAAAAGGTPPAAPPASPAAAQSARKRSRLSMMDSYFTRTGNAAAVIELFSSDSD